MRAATANSRWARPIRAILWGTLGLGAMLPGCSGCVEKVPVESEPEPVVDVTADREAARNSWLIQLAQDPQPLIALADSSPGWADLFTGNAKAGLNNFQGDAVPTRIGRARAALQLAEAHAELAALVRSATPNLLAAQKTRPNAAAGAPWRALMLARLQGDYSKVPDDGPVGALKARLSRPEALAPLATDPDGFWATVPEEAGATWRRRLAIKALAQAGKVDAALRKAKRLKSRRPDFKITTGDETLSFRDPGAADALALLYAAVAEQAVRDVPGWPSLLRARALVLLGRPAEAVPLFEAFTQALPPEGPHLAQLVLSTALNVDDLLTETWARLALAAAAAQDQPRVDAALKTLAGRTRTLGDRVWGGYVQAALGKPVEANLFPTDRRELLVPLREEVANLGPDAKGKQDVDQLLLIDRYVDGLQRRYAALLLSADKPALAVKMREAAEEKSANLSPSSRNSVSSLAATARANMSVNRPRVALKYLVRLADALPDAHGPAEMLRDLLSLRAMEQGGSATAGH